MTENRDFQLGKYSAADQSVLSLDMPHRNTVLGSKTQRCSNANLYIKTF